MILTDTHTHLYGEAFDEDRHEVVERALKCGVSRFFIPAIDATYTEAMLALEKAYPAHMFLMMGLHPTHVKEGYKAELRHVQDMLAERKFYAVGEIGIDLYWDKTTLLQQQEAFRTQIDWAKAYGLPIVIHCRDAFDEVFAILEEKNDDALFGIFHCFTGTLEQAERAISFGLKLGIGGVATFKNGKIDTFLDTIDLQHIVLETDAPYLAPVPYRGKRNESSYLRQVAEKVATIYGKDISEIAAVTTANSKQVFGI